MQINVHWNFKKMSMICPCWVISMISSSSVSLTPTTWCMASASVQAWARTHRFLLCYHPFLEVTILQEVYVCTKRIKTTAYIFPDHIHIGLLAIEGRSWQHNGFDAQKNGTPVNTSSPNSVAIFIQNIKNFYRENWWTNSLKFWPTLAMNPVEKCTCLTHRNGVSDKYQVITSFWLPKCLKPNWNV